MIRVLNVISDSNIGGAGRVLINYLTYADKDNFDTYVALPEGSMLIEPIEKAGGKIIELDGLAERSYSKDDVRLLEKVIRELKPDIVHTHGALSGRIAARRCGCKVVYTRHSAFPVPAKLKYPPGRWVNKWVNEYYADAIIAVSPAAKENLTDSGISEKYITTMMNGVAPVKRSTDDDIKRFKEQFEIPEDSFVILLLARIEEYKGHAILLEAAKKLRDENRNFRIVFAGEGSFENKLKQLVNDAGLENYVVFTGFAKDVAPLLSAADLQVNASFGTETSSLSVLEGFSMGLAAVVSSYGGNPMLVDNGVNGIIFENKNAAKLHMAISGLMDDREKLAAMGREAERIYTQRFSGEVFAANIENVYRKVMKGARK